MGEAVCAQVVESGWAALIGGDVSLQRCPLINEVRCGNGRVPC
jgi:hypothetical protein